VVFFLKRTGIQWIPSHCNIQGNDEADRLAKEGAKLPETRVNITYNEAKNTWIKASYKMKWRKNTRAIGGTMHTTS
jgi:hypothetical protein